MVQEKPSRIVENVFRVGLVLLLCTIAVTQILILQRLSEKPVTRQSLRDAKTPEAHRDLARSIPLVDIFGTVDVSGSVDVDNTVDVHVAEQPVGVDIW